MTLYRELDNEHEVETVRGVQFCLLGPEEIMRRSVCEVNTPEMYSGNEPASGGLFDPRMGVLDHNRTCHTCEQTCTFCPGHFGHIVLAKPVLHVQFFDIVKKLLSCVCFRCSRLLLDINGPEVRTITGRKISRQKRWELMYKACSKVTRCGAKSLDGCGAKQPDKISREGVLRIAMEWKEAGGGTEGEDVTHKQVLTAEDVLRILRRITDAEADALGFCPRLNRPEWMIATVLPVPPPAVRPSVRTEAGQRSEDDLTHKLNSIVKINNMLKSKIDRATSAEQYDMLLQLLQYEVATLVDNNIPGLPQSHQRGRPIKSISDRLKSKEGRIRGNLMGKRVDFSARSVITPDPNIGIDELGVPVKIALNMTFPEVVNSYNMEELRNLVRTGPDTFPGAKFVIKRAENGRKLRLRGVDRDAVARNLALGDVVERHMRDGDYVLFNRQPSLHKMSMMAHRVRVMPHNTFRLNVCVTPGYNADYDGDKLIWE